MKHSDTKVVDAVLAQARSVAPVPSDDLMARILADAAAARPVAPQTVLPATQGIWGLFMDAIGGWPAAGGLAMAGVVGIWVGIAPPTTVATWTSELIGTSETVDLFGDTTEYFAESFIDG